MESVMKIRRNLIHYTKTKHYIYYYSLADFSFTNCYYQNKSRSKLFGRKNKNASNKLLLRQYV